MALPWLRPTTGPLANAATQAHLAAQMPQHAVHLPPSGDWELILGEFIIFSRPCLRPAIDRLKGLEATGERLHNGVLGL